MATISNALQLYDSMSLSLCSMFTKLANTITSEFDIKQVLQLSDTMVQASTRLDRVNDGLQTTDELQNKVFAAAQNSGSSYLGTMDAVSKLGSLAGNAFANNDEMIAFVDQLNKQFIIAGTSAEGIDDVMLQITQTMSSGVLSSDQLTSVLDKATPIVQSIADYLGVPVENIKDMAAQGQITADIMKNAMFASADEVNSRFESMPTTFGQIWTSIQNQALLSLQPVLQKLNDVANSDWFSQFVTSVANNISTFAARVTWAFDLIANIAAFVFDNWSLISPAIYGVVAAIAIYEGYLAVTNAIELISNGLKIASCIASYAKAAATNTEVTANVAATASQYGLNTALLACPLTWILIIIIAVIAAIYGIVAAINKATGSTLSATGIICAAFMVAFAFIGNIIIAAWNLIVDVAVLINNLLADLANFIGNVFTDPIGSICRLFFDLADTVLGVLEALASAVDTLFGSHLSDSVQGWRNSLSGWVDDTFGEGTEIVAKMNPDDLKLKSFDYNTAAYSGIAFGEGLDNNISNIFGGSNSLDASNLESILDGIYGNTGDTAANTASTTDSMDSLTDSLEYMRDIAERETINRFTTAEITVEQTNNNHINSDMDIDGVMDKWNADFTEILETAAEGVHS